MNSIKTILIAFVAGLAGSFVFHAYHTEKERRERVEAVSLPNSGFTSSALPTTRASATTEFVDFTSAAAKTLPSVVYINSISKGAQGNSYWDILFGGSPQRK